jgi:antitoxin VapB
VLRFARLPIPLVSGRIRHCHVPKEHAVDIAKVFMTGRSQAVRLPKAYRFATGEVSIERQPDGAVLLRPRPQGLLGDRLWAALDGLPDDPSFVRPDQGEPEVRDWLDAPARAPRKAAVARKSPRKR